MHRVGCLKLDFTRPFAALFVTAVMVAQSGCARIGGSLTHLPGLNDFAKSQMLVLNSAVANGTDLVYINVHLMNSDGTVVSNFTPTLDVETGSSILPPQCFSSDKNGISVCPVRALTAGVRTVRIRNLSKINLSKQIKFKSIPLRRDQISAVAGSAQTFTAGHYTVRAVVNNSGGPLKQSAGPYTLYSGVEGSVTAQSGATQ